MQSQQPVNRAQTTYTMGGGAAVMGLLSEWLIRREGLCGLAVEYCCKQSVLSSVKCHNKATVQITDTDNINDC